MINVSHYCRYWGAEGRSQSVSLHYRSNILPTILLQLGFFHIKPRNSFWPWISKKQWKYLKYSQWEKRGISLRQTRTTLQNQYHVQCSLFPRRLPQVLGATCFLWGPRLAETWLWCTQNTYRQPVLLNDHKSGSSRRTASSSCEHHSRTKGTLCEEWGTESQVW